MLGSARDMLISVAATTNDIAEFLSGRSARVTLDLLASWSATPEPATTTADE